LIGRTDNSRRRDEEYEEQQRRREALIDADWDAVTDWHGDTSDFGKRMYDRALRSWRFGVQEDALSAVDHLARHLVESHASLRARDPVEFYELTASSLDLLGSMRYALNLGRLPAREGEPGTFRESLRATLAARVKDYPNLYPLQHPVGLTAFVVPGPAGKDADNVFRDLVVPILLDQIQPPRQASDDADADVRRLSLTFTSSRPSTSPEYPERQEPSSLLFPWAIAAGAGGNKRLMTTHTARY
jgi:hypothetical protein